MARLSLPPAAAHAAVLLGLLAREGVPAVQARQADVRAAVAAEHDLRTRPTLPPGADDAAAKRWARRPLGGGR